MRHTLLFLSFIAIWSFGLLGQAPTANFTISDNVLCSGECIIIINNSSANSLSFTWSFPGGTPSVFNGQNPGSVCFNTPGTYTVSLTVSNTFGSNTATQTVEVGAIPTLTTTITDTLNGIQVPIQDTTIFMFEEAYMRAVGSPSGGTLMWYASGNLADSIFGCSPCTAEGSSLTVTPFYNTCYTAVYTTGNGCAAADTICVEVRFSDYFRITLPNSFTPNEDGENDVFRILTNVDANNNFNDGFTEGGSIAEIDFRIYDRYGKMVFRTINPLEGWDGTYKGKPLNPATYTYYVSYRRIDGRSGELKGNVTLIR